MNLTSGLTVKLFRILLWMLPLAAISFGQAPFSSTESLIKDGIPPIPASLIEKASTYSNYGWSSLLYWDSTKKEMVINWRYGESMRLYKLSVPLQVGGNSGTATEIKDFPVAQELIYQPGSHNLIAYAGDTNANVTTQIYLYDVEAGKSTCLTDGKSRNTDPLWSPSGRYLAYGSNLRTGSNPDIYYIDTTDPEKKSKLAGQIEAGYTVPLDWSPDERNVLVYNFINTDEINLWMINVATGEKTLLTPSTSNRKLASWTGKFSKNGKGIYLTTNVNSDFQQLAYLDLKTKKLKYLTKDINWDVTELELSPDGKTVAFIVNMEGISKLRLLDTVKWQEKSPPQIETGIIRGLKWHPMSHELGFLLESVKSQGDVYSCNIDTLKVEKWTLSTPKYLRQAELPEAQIIKWKSFDNLSISGFIYRPNQEKFRLKHPVIIDVHGGPQEQAQPGYLKENTYFLNELGAAIIFPNIRGSYGYGKRFVALDDGLRREDAIKDIGTLLSWIKTQPDLDSDRIMVMGESYGGFVALSVAAQFNDQIRATVTRSGISNLVTHLQKMTDSVRERRRQEYGDERDACIRSFLEKIAPVNNSTKIRKPLFVVHGALDPRVPLSEAEQIVAAVRKSGVPVWFLTAKDEGHIFNKKNNIDFEFYTTVLFVEKYLLNK